MKIGIIGGGSIGLLVSSFFSLEHEVTLYVRREEQKEKINKHGLWLDESNIRHIKALLINEMKQEDCFVVCIKQPQITSILPFIQNLRSNIPIIFLQNGMGHIELIKTLNNSLYLGVVEHGAVRKSDYQVNHTGKGLIRLASYQGSNEQFKNLLTELNHFTFPIEASSNWKQLLSKKLVVNSVINPLTTLFQVKNKQIIDNPYIYQLAKQLCREAADTLNLSYQTEWKNVRKVVSVTGENTSSMLMDMNNKQETEIEAITGYLLKKSKRKVPYSLFVYNSIKALEVKNGIY